MGRKWRSWIHLPAAALAALLAHNSGASIVTTKQSDEGDITPTGLHPLYPDGRVTSPLTSLYASWIDVDGLDRDEIHSGVDGGSLGEPILSPGPGVVVAAWEADWGWGTEGALIIQHSREDLNLTQGAPYYYSVFCHLRFADVSHYRPGQKIARGQILAKVDRPGGKKKYLPEVHWEVWEVDDPSKLSWFKGKQGKPVWWNETASLVDPLYMLSLETGSRADGGVPLQPFDTRRSWAGFRGFTYILPSIPAGATVARPDHQDPRS